MAISAAKILERARSVTGGTYVWGAAGANNGWDCSGFVSYCVSGQKKHLFSTDEGSAKPFLLSEGLKIVTDSCSWSNNSKSNGMIPGDVLVKYSYTVNGVRHAGHTVIYNGDGKTLGASSSQNKCAATDTVQGLGVGSGNFTKGDVFRPLGVSLEYWPEKGKKIAV